MQFKTYIITMKKDAGRQLISSELKNIMEAEYWPGIDPSLIKNEYLVSCADIKEATYCAKKAKLELFKHFMKNVRADYLVLFEDDIYLHKDFEKNLEKVKKFIESNNPLLLYLGVSNNRTFVDSQDITIEILNNNKNQKACPGAYAVYIHNSTIPYLISYIKDPTNKYNPFDMTCLGIIQMLYPTMCYITNPPLVIPDVTSSNIRYSYEQTIYYNNANINPKNYIFPKYKPFFIYTKNSTRTEYLNKLLKVFTPYYKLIFLNKLDITHKINSEYYILMTDNIKFKYYDAQKIINSIETNILNYDKISFIQESRDCYFMALRSNLSDNINVLNINIDGCTKI